MRGPRRADMPGVCGSGTCYYDVGKMEGYMEAMRNLAALRSNQETYRMGQG
jgi:UTP-glucose-1-phosphate uridylyltransferase